MRMSVGVNMSEYFVYILRCCDNTFYIGITNDLAKRVEDHNRGKGAKYTKGRTPVILHYFEPGYNRSDALKREHTLRKLNHQQKEAIGNTAGS